jgi:hypothetical protein
MSSPEREEEVRELLKKKCHENGGEYIEDYDICRIDIEGIDFASSFPQAYGIMPTSNLKEIYARIRLPTTPSFRLPRGVVQILDKVVKSAGLTYETPWREYYEYYTIIWAKPEDFDKLVQVLKEIGREFKAMYGEYI